MFPLSLKFYSFSIIIVGPIGYDMPGIIDAHCIHAHIASVKKTISLHHILKVYSSHRCYIQAHSRFIQMFIYLTHYIYISHTRL